MLYRDIIQIPEVIEYGRKQREEGKKAGKEEDVRNMAAMGIPKTKISRISGFSMERVSSVLQTEAAPDPPDWVRIADYAEVSPDFAVSSYGTVQWEEGEEEGKEEDALGMATLGFSGDEIASVTGFTAEKVKTVLQTGSQPSTQAETLAGVRSGAGKRYQEWLEYEMNPVERAVREEIAGNLAIMGMSREQIVQATRLSMEWVDYLVAVIRRKNEFWMRKQQPGSDS